MSDIWRGRNNEGDITVTPMQNGLFSYSYIENPTESFEISAKELCDFFEPKNPKGDHRKPKHSHYHKDVSQYDTIDVYAVCKIFDVQDTSGCLQHAIKKLLVTGRRGHKDRQTDIQNAIDTLNRLLELEHD